MKTPTAQALHAAAFTSFFFLAILSPSMAADFSGKLKGVTISDATATNKPPVANISQSISGTIVTFDASGSTDSDGIISKYKWNFSDGTTAEGPKVTYNLASSDSIQTTLTLIDNLGGVSLEQVTCTTKKTIALNFGPENSATASGYLLDNGLAYDPSIGYGWTGLAPGNTNTRERTSDLNIPLINRTLIQAQSKHGPWEVTLPNGTYSVTISCGDLDYDAACNVSAQGVKILNTYTKKGNFIEGSQDVEVANGKLSVTIDSTGDSKLNWITIK